jgi:protein-disulfide isomerase
MPTTLTPEKKKLQDLTAIAIVLGGLFAGSLLVDFVQLATGSGFSQHILKKSSVLETNGKTWVAYEEPKVTLEVITDKSCLTCNTEEALTWIQRLIPTAEVVEVDGSSAVGKKRIQDFHLTVLPGFIFSEKVKNTEFYNQTKELFQPVEKSFAFQMQRIGFTGGKYLNPPTKETNDITLGNPEAPVQVVVYTDFQCEFCKDFHQSLSKALVEYGDQIAVTYRHLPLSFHTQAPLAALASQCAHAQGAFAAYSDKLFEEQAVWGNSTGSAWFRNQAQVLKLNAKDFNTCMNSKTYAEKIAHDAFSAEEFALSGTPSTFVNTTLLSGAVDYATLKRVINQSLGK